MDYSKIHTKKHKALFFMHLFQEKPSRTQFNTRLCKKCRQTHTLEPADFTTDLEQEPLRWLCRSRVSGPPPGRRQRHQGQQVEQENKPRRIQQAAKEPRHQEPRQARQQAQRQHMVSM